MDVGRRFLGSLLFLLLHKCGTYLKNGTGRHTLALTVTLQGYTLDDSVLDSDLEGYCM